MKSLILTILYLTKDTVHRWFTRISSPLARVLVVYFLTLSALAALGGYVISTNVVRDKIIQRGANMVAAIMSAKDGKSIYVPTQREISNMMDADSYLLNQVGSASIPGGQQVSLYTCGFSRLGQMLPLLAPSGRPTLLQSAANPRMSPGPGDITVNRIPVSIYVRTLPESHPVIRLMHGAGVIVQQDDLERMGLRPSHSLHNFALVVNNLNSSEQVRQAERFMRSLISMEQINGHIISALPFLEELDVVLSKQTQCRIAFILGISFIVGILLTALAGMEYRQNEYIYTLMKSFGIHPILLVGAFITENIVIVGASFAGALATFMYCQRIIVTQIMKLGNYTLSLHEIMPEIMLVSYTLLGCVLVSSIPIAVAANRQIGRVLK